MAWMNQEKKKIIATALKEVFKDYKIKYSLKVLHHSSISLTIREGDVDFISNWEKINQMIANGNYLQVNQYWIESNFSGIVKDILLKVDEAMRSADWYDKSDAMVDYFETAYYYDIRIGAWDKPYKLLAQ